MAMDQPTAPVPVADTASVPAVAIHAEDPDDEWITPTNSGRAVRVRYLTGALVVLVLLAGGFWGGVTAEKHHGNGSANSTLSALASRFAAGRATTGTGGRPAGGSFAFPGTGGAAGSGATIGTVIDVQGHTLDITDSSGNLVKVTVPSSATVTRTASTPLSGLQIGDTVVVQGTSGSGGVLSATSVRATAKGTTGGGFRSATGGGA